MADTNNLVDFRARHAQKQDDERAAAAYLEQLKQVADFIAEAAGEGDYDPQRISDDNEFLFKHNDVSERAAGVSERVLAHLFHHLRSKETRRLIHLKRKPMRNSSLESLCDKLNNSTAPLWELEFIYFAALAIEYERRMAYIVLMGTTGGSML